MISENLVVEMSSVVKQFKGSHGLVSLSLCVKRGSVFGLLGANGAGKTTTMRILLGLLRPQSGEVLVLGVDPVLQGSFVRKNVGVLLANDGLYGRLSAWRNLDFTAQAWRIPRKEYEPRIEDLLKSVSLWDRRHDRVITWSKGMRVKLALMRALIHRPRLLLLDEPFSGLDPMSAVDLRTRISILAGEEGVTTVVATHDLSHVERMCDEIAVIQSGALAYQGKPGDVGKHIGREEITVFVRGVGLNNDLLEDMVAQDNFISHSQTGDGVLIRCSPVHRRRLGSALAKRGVEIEELTNSSSSLENDVLALLSQDLGETR